MERFWLNIEFGTEGSKSLLPAKCDLRTRFSFIRSKITCHFVSYHWLPKVLTDSITNENDMIKMFWVRPDTLDPTEQQIYEQALRAKVRNDSAQHANPTNPKRKKGKRGALGCSGRQDAHRIRSNFGTDNQGYIRMNPILNPLYMGYDHHRGFTYKLMCAPIIASPTYSEISTRFKRVTPSGKNSFYFRMPLIITSTSAVMDM
jgi:hypothetical protein